ncbi:MAG: hypothetical protein MUE42_00195 [Opitutaceae bacterium]|jgi:hypothetical protein|nr:hypothetical protein [Opitutaceae bacterium]
MKKTTAKPAVTKSSAAKPAAAAKPVAKKPAAPVKKATAPAASAKAVKPAAKVAVAKVGAVKATKPTKAKAPAKVSAQVALPATTIVAAIDVGFGNHLTLRGEGAGLSWEKGLPLECSADDRWSITLPSGSQPIVCKFLINDETWCAGDDYTVLPGASVVLSPSF